MPTKRLRLCLVIAIAAIVLIGLLAFRFLMPANCSALLREAQYVVINVVEHTAEDGMPETNVYELNLEPSDRELIELKNLFAEYNCFYTMKKDGNLNLENYSVEVDNATITFMFNTTDGKQPTGSFVIGGKYIVSGENVWKIGLNKQKAEDLQLRLYDFIMEHQESADE